MPSLRPPCPSSAMRLRTNREPTLPFLSLGEEDRRGGKPGSSGSLLQNGSVATTLGPPLSVTAFPQVSKILAGGKEPSYCREADI